MKVYILWTYIWEGEDTRQALLAIYLTEKEAEIEREKQGLHTQIEEYTIGELKEIY